jgi:hypothetical protein
MNALRADVRSEVTGRAEREAHRGGKGRSDFAGIAYPSAPPNRIGATGSLLGAAVPGCGDHDIAIGAPACFVEVHENRVEVPEACVDGPEHWIVADAKRVDAAEDFVDALAQRIEMVFLGANEPRQSSDVVDTECDVRRQTRNAGEQFSNGRFLFGGVASHGLALLGVS